MKVKQDLSSCSNKMLGAVQKRCQRLFKQDVQGPFKQDVRGCSNKMLGAVKQDGIGPSNMIIGTIQTKGIVQTRFQEPFFKQYIKDCSKKILWAFQARCQGSFKQDLKRPFKQDNRCHSSKSQGPFKQNVRGCSNKLLGVVQTRCQWLFKQDVRATQTRC